jgi:hypothetical protein
LKEAIDFMKANSNVDNFDGFYDFEIAKLERNLAIMQERNSLDPHKVILDMKNFASYFDQYDMRKNINLVEIFPELESFYQECKNL